jgi:hypothetical protein
MLAARFFFRASVFKVRMCSVVHARRFDTFLAIQITPGFRKVGFVAESCFEEKPGKSRTKAIADMRTLTLSTGRGAPDIGAMAERRLPRLNTPQPSGKLGVIRWHTVGKREGAGYEIWHYRYGYAIPRESGHPLLADFRRES